MDKKQETKNLLNRLREYRIYLTERIDDSPEELPSCRSGFAYRAGRYSAGFENLDKFTKDFSEFFETNDDIPF